MIFRFVVTFQVKGGLKVMKDMAEVHLPRHKSLRIAFKVACLAARAPYESAGHTVLEVKQLV